MIIQMQALVLIILLGQLVSGVQQEVIAHKIHAGVQLLMLHVLLNPAVNGMDGLLLDGVRR